jgi:hypothetical protein
MLDSPSGLTPARSVNSDLSGLNGSSLSHNSVFRSGTRSLNNQVEEIELDRFRVAPRNRAERSGFAIRRTRVGL